jgi:hypothetical protein
MWFSRPALAKLPPSDSSSRNPDNLGHVTETQLSGFTDMAQLVWFRE